MHGMGVQMEGMHLLSEPGVLPNILLSPKHAGVNLQQKLHGANIIL